MNMYEIGFYHDIKENKIGIIVDVDYWLGSIGLVINVDGCWD